ncbi:diacylglycerol kinase family protein [Nocardia sp. NPDC006044]|uniref:diacylglycerol kinase family protein n=1 Tax=Nocardia sp. NPDC006044 TaxID=3364306 RepID=UPI00368468A0
MSPLSVRSAAAGVASIDLVTYPCSEWGRGLPETVRAAHYLAERGIRVRQIRGASFESSIQLLRERLAGPHRPDAVVCVGGDDLIAVALQATAITGTPLGLLPLGRNNRLATALGIPSDDPRAAAEIVLAGRRRGIDLGVIGSGSDTATPIPARWFATAVHAAAGGVAVGRHRHRWPRVEPELESFRLEMSCASGGSPVVIEACAVLVTVGRGRTRLADGLLEITAIGTVAHRASARLFAALAAGRPVVHPAVSRYRAAAVTVGAPGVDVAADGVLLGRLPVTIRTVVAAQTVLAP